MLKRKIAILTLFHGNNNWGGVLQGFALKQIIEKLYPDSVVDILNYRSGVNIVYPSLFKQMLQYPLMEIPKVVAKRVLKRNKGYVIEKLKIRRELFAAFMKEHDTNPIKYNDETLKQAAEQYDVFISGSDQVWNPNVARAGYFQTMIPDSCKRIAYAASIARDGLSPHEQSVMLPLIERFDYVSVREKTARIFLQEYLGGKKEIEEVLDPALLLTKEQWIEEAGDSDCDGDYALAFFFSDSYEYRKYIQEYCKKYKLKLKFIPFAAEQYIKSDEKGECEREFDVGPKEFIKLFQNAKCVFTDSFHGSVFSIIFQKYFCVFERDKQNKTSKNSRLYDLLNKFELSERLIQNPKLLEEKMQNPIDYESTNSLLEKYRQLSFDFLKKSIGD